MLVGTEHQNTNGFLLYIFFGFSRVHHHLLLPGDSGVTARMLTLNEKRYLSTRLLALLLNETRDKGFFEIWRSSSKYH